MNKEELRNLMENIPGSYDDFVNSTVRWMVKDGKIESAIITQLRNNPKSDTSDILEVLCECLGIGEPLELVDDEFAILRGKYEDVLYHGTSTDCVFEKDAELRVRCMR